MLLPNAEFWRLWARACAVMGLLLTGYLAATHPARAAIMRTSFYGAESGSHNADGSRFAPMGLTAAHRSLPFGTQLQACYRGCVTVVVRDRGPALWTGRALDLSHGAARAIGLEHAGVAGVDVTVVGRVASHRAPRAARARPFSRRWGKGGHRRGRWRR